jgi:hypothetical protein
MHLLMILLRPMIAFQRWLADRVVSLLGVHDRAHYVTEEEIKTLVDAGQEEGVIESEEKEMIYSIFQFGDTSVREVMIPRMDMIAVRLDTPLDEAVRTVLEAAIRASRSTRTTSTTSRACCTPRTCSSCGDAAAMATRSRGCCARPTSCRRAKTRSTCSRKCCSSASTWRWWSTSTAARPGWSRWKT